MLLYVVLAVVAVFVALFLVACVRTVLIKNRAAKGEPLVPNAQMAQKYAKDLGAMLQCETINDEGLEEETVRAGFARMRAVLERRFPLCHQNMQRTLLGDALLMRWEGKDPNRGAIVLMAHSDVVPATGQWQYPPFSGQIADGRVWGRGAVDTKGSLCAIFEACENLLQQGFVPVCDVYISSSNNEETMGDGAAKAVQYLKDKGVAIDIVSDEGGLVLEAPMAGLSGHFAMLGIVEKGFGVVKFTAKSTGGHASAPGKNSPLAKLAAFVHHVEKHSPFKKEISTPVRQMFEALAPHMPFTLRLLLGNLWLFGPLVKVLLPALSPQAGAMLQTTCAFTMANGSAAPNVMPETASVTANLRYIMHQPMQQSNAAIQALAQKFGLEAEVVYANDCSPYVDVSSENYRYMVECVKKTFPEVGVSPYIMIGGTDARHFAELCPCTLRFAPLVMNQQQLGGMHGLDENVFVDSLARAVDFYTNVIADYK